jgi:4-diphosphocytidyl-2-C-methyl-D-erythritol kinase
MPTEREMRICVKAPAKINLTFDVTGDLPGGYHSIVSLFHAITLEDWLTVQIYEQQEDAFKLEMSAEFVGEPGVFPLDDNNLIAKAARAFDEKTKLLARHSIRVAVKKQIPIGAGLAGGSSNAAAMLVALNSLTGSPLGIADLCELATRLGADVPFLISGGTQLGKGKGEILSSVSVAEPMTFIVAKPRQLAVSTPSVFAAYDKWVDEKGLNWKPPVDHDAAIDSLGRGDLESATKCFANVFEPIVFNMHPDLASVKEKLLEFGCWSAQLSGSGPSIFGVVANMDMAHMIRRRLKETEARGEAAWMQKSAWDLDCFFAQSAGAGVSVEMELSG